MSMEYTTLLGWGFIHKMTPQSLSVIRGEIGWDSNSDNYDEELEELLYERSDTSFPDIRIISYHSEAAAPSEDDICLFLEKDSIREYASNSAWQNYLPEILHDCKSSPSLLALAARLGVQDIGWVHTTMVY